MSQLYTLTLNVTLRTRASTPFCQSANDSLNVVVGAGAGDLAGAILILVGAEGVEDAGR